jgi:phage recombination protein Bet
MSNTIITTVQSSALSSMATRLSIEPEKLMQVLKSTVFSACRNDEEMAALVVVANEYGLNPLLKEIYAFPAKGGGIMPMVPIDGWVKLINNRPQLDGIEFVTINDSKGELQAVTCRIFRTDRTKPIEVTEYLSECFRNTEPWKMKHRMLRHKALMQCARYAFGFSGIHDEDEATDAAPLRDVTPIAKVEPVNPFPARIAAVEAKEEAAAPVAAKDQPKTETAQHKTIATVMSVTDAGEDTIIVLRGKSGDVVATALNTDIADKAAGLIDLPCEVRVKKATAGPGYVLHYIEIYDDQEGGELV